MNIRSTDHCKQLLHINELLIDIYLQANQEAGLILAAENIPKLIPFLNDLQDSDPSLQPIKRLIPGASPLFIPPQSSVYLEIDGWIPIPINRHLWLMMRWMYEATMLLYLSSEGRDVVRFRYQHILEWVEGSQAVNEAQNKRNIAENNGIMEEILSLAERHAPTHSLGANLINFTPGLKFPYMRQLPHIHFGKESATSVGEGETSSTREPSNSDLVYPFLDLNEDNSLPILGPIITSTLLPSDSIQRNDTIQINGEADSQIDLTLSHLGSLDEDINSSSPSSPSAHRLSGVLAYKGFCPTQLMTLDN